MAGNATTSKSINIEHLEEKSDIIIYIVGLIIIIIIIWMITTICQVRLHRSGLEGNLKVVKKFITTVGRVGDYIPGIDQSYALGFTLYRLHTNVDGTFVTPVRTYDRHVYVLDDVTTMKVTTQQITADNISSKLLYIVKGDDDGGMGFALHGDRRPSGVKGLKGDCGDRGVAGSRGPTGKRGAAGPGGPPRKIGKVGPVGARGGAGACGEQGDRGDTGGVGQQGHICPQGSMGPLGSQATGAAGSKGDKDDPAVEVDIVAELCKHLPMEMVEQYRRGAYIRYAINSMKDMELREAIHVKTNIDKCGGRCNATQSDVMRMASFSQTHVNSNYVLNFHNDAYNMDADVADFHYFCVFWHTKLRLMQRSRIGNAII